MKEKRPFINPAIIIIYLLLAGSILYFSVYGLETIARPILFAILLAIVFFALSWHVLKPFHPLEIDNNHVIIKRFLLKNHIIEKNDLLSIEKFNRYDRLDIKTKEKKYTLLFLLKTDDFVKEVERMINKPIKK